MHIPVGVTRVRETTLIFFILYICTLKPKSCASHNSHTELFWKYFVGTYVKSSRNVAYKKDSTHWGRFLVIFSEWSIVRVITF